MDLSRFAQLSASSEDAFETVVLHRHKVEDPEGRAFAAWRASLNQVQNSSAQNVKNAAEMLILFAYFDPNDISYDLIKRGLVDPSTPDWFRDSVATEESMAQVMEVLIKHSLISDTCRPNCYSIHSLSHSFCKEYASLVENHAKLPLAVSIIGFCIPRSWDPHSFEVEQRVLPHVESILDSVGESIFLPSLNFGAFKQPQQQLARSMLGYSWPGYELFPDTINPIGLLANFLQAQNRSEDALELLEAGLAGLDGKGHARTVYVTKLDLWSDYAWFVGKFRDTKRARALAHQAVFGLSDLFGPNSINTLRAKMTLANTLYFSERYSECLALEKDVVERAVAKFGEESIYVHLLRQKLANTLEMVGDHDKALSMLEDLTKQFKMKLGLQHKVTLEALSQLAQLAYWYNPGGQDYEDVLCLQWKILDDCAAKYGPTHRATLREAGHLAEMLEDNGDFDKSLKVRLSFVEALKRGAPEKKHSIAEFVFEMAKTQFKQGCMKEAESSIAEAVRLTEENSLCEKFAGLQSTLAKFLNENSKQEDAITLLENCLQAQESVLPQLHPFVITSLGSLADQYKQSGMLGRFLRVHIELVKRGLEINPYLYHSYLCSQAMRLVHSAACRNLELELNYEESMTLARRALCFFLREGPEYDWDRSMCWYAISGFAYRLGDIARAEKAALEALKFQEYRTDPEAFMIISDLAQLFEQIDRTTQAEKLQLHVLRGFQHLGYNTWTIKTAASLGDLYDRTGRLKEARKMYELAVNIGRPKPPCDVSHWLHACLGLSVVQHKLGSDLVSAEKRLKALLGKGGYVDLYGLGSEEVSGVTKLLMHVLRCLGKFAEARRYAVRRLEGERMSFGDTETPTLQALTDIIILSILMRDISHAKKLMLKAVEYCKYEFGIWGLLTRRAMKTFVVIEELEFPSLATESSLLDGWEFKVRGLQMDIIRPDGYSISNWMLLDSLGEDNIAPGDLIALEDLITAKDMARVLRLIEA